MPTQNNQTPMLPQDEEGIVPQNSGSGSAYKPFSTDWDTSHTTKDFCDDVNADETAVKGEAYLGEVTFSDLPADMVNAELVVEIMDGEGTSGKVIHLILTSGNTNPYRWEYTYWNDGSNVSGWIAFQTKITVNPTLAGTESALEGLEVDGTKYKVKQPTDVVANPTLAGTESELKSLKVGNEKYKVFHPEQCDANYLVGRVFSQIKVGFTADGTQYHIVAWQLVNKVNTFAGIDVAFDTFRDLGLTIPTIEDNETFTNAMQLVYTANPQAFQMLLIQLAVPNYYTIKTMFWTSGSINEHDLIDAGDGALAYIEYQGSPATPTLVSFNATLDTIFGNAITGIYGMIND